MKIVQDIIGGRSLCQRVATNRLRLKFDDLPPWEAFYKALYSKTKDTSRIWSLQQITVHTHHLAFESTRYAHFYPQELWKTADSVARHLPGNRCVARLSRGDLRFPCGVADDGALTPG